jgi:7,8-dihydro-6-hydroxymethylpterin-pyrophosphokinase
VAKATTNSVAKATTTNKVSQWLKSLLKIKSVVQATINSVAKATTNLVAKATTTNKVSHWLKSLLEIKSVIKATTATYKLSG